MNHDEELHQLLINVFNGMSATHIWNKMKGILYTLYPPNATHIFIDAQKRDQTRFIEKQKDKGKDIDVILDPYLLEEAWKANPDSNWFFET